MSSKKASVTKLPTREELIEQFEFNVAEAQKEFARYVKMFGACPNPPPCLECDLKTWAYCAETEWACRRFAEYVEDPKAEKGAEE